MATMGRWGKKTFEVSTRKVNPFSNFTTSAESKADDSKSKKKKPSIELETVSISVICNANAGVNPQKEYYSWRKLINKSNYLYIHGKKWKSNPLILKSVGLGSTQLDDFGRFRVAELSLSFEEKNQKRKKKTSRVKASKSEKKARKK